MNSDIIKIISPNDIVFSNYKRHIADAVVLTSKRRILMQRKPHYWRYNPGALCLFGGHVEFGETIFECLSRELHEELGASITAKNTQKIGAVSEAFTRHEDLVHIFFWNDEDGSIKGCYEGEPEEFDRVDDILSQDGLMEYARWSLIEAKRRGLIL